MEFKFAQVLWEQSLSTSDKPSTENGEKRDLLFPKATRIRNCAICRFVPWMRFCKTKEGKYEFLSEASRLGKKYYKHEFLRKFAEKTNKNWMKRENLRGEITSIWNQINGTTKSLWKVPNFSNWERLTLKGTLTDA